MSNQNPLYDKAFLDELFLRKNREIYAKVIVLNFNDESPIEQIEGRVQNGSINIDGASSVRRTCNLTLVSSEIDYRNFYIGLKSKFKLEIGLKNTIDKKYPDVIWFPQGTYVTASYNTSHNASSYSISIQGRDKMCLLNGDLGGLLVAETDFGKIETVNNDNSIEYDFVPIVEIIRETVHTYTNEPYHNIIINDIPNYGVELLEYRGDNTLYFYKNSNGIFQNFTYNGETKIAYGKDKIQKKISELDNVEDFTFESMVNELGLEGKATKVYSVGPGEEVLPEEYTLAKIAYGETVGYRQTSLTYPGDLIGKPGESVVSILDKIKKMLGDYEYFYNLDGQFIFQRQQIYTSNSWNNIVETDGERYIEPAALTSSVEYSFTDSHLITAFNNTPNLGNLKNDFIVWGSRDGITGQKIPVHMRVAIDKKPLYYCSVLTGKGYISKEFLEAFDENLEEKETIKMSSELVDWRELIYQMAIDYYKYHLEDNFLQLIMDSGFNKKYYPYGYTMYERYYMDLQGFWRMLYNPSSLERMQNKSEFYVDDEKVFISDEYINVESWMKKSELDVENKYIYPDTIGENPECSLERYEVDLTDEEWGLLCNKFIQENEDDVFNKEEKNALLKNEVEKILNDSKYQTKFKNYTIIANDLENKEKLKKRISILSNTFFKELSDSAVRWNNKEDASTILEQNKEKITVLDFFTLDKKEEDKYIFKDADSKDKLAAFLRLRELLESENFNSEEILDSVISYYSVERRTEIKDEDGVVYPYPYKTIYHIYQDVYNKQESSGSLMPDEITAENKWESPWSKTVLEHPDSINFWFDFLDPEGELGEFSIPSVGNRPKVVNDDKVNAIYYRETPGVLFINQNKYTQEEQLALLSDSSLMGYTPVYSTDMLENYFSISAQGKSAKDAIDELIFQHSYCTESASITAVPIYTLKPNRRIKIVDEKSNVNGEYIVSKITLPLTYNGTMSISAVKAIDRIL